ncbi:amino acid ABC transporter permease [Neobacillus thermocopriae]|uniref:amino acid ABC transporter permease n=1 Tax=Neobacillus thermocopriae TaxID=1215031 RepID=UPI002E220ACF|nr:amino acid ABC transporter permease [Neobacillus thermocopriae]MED3713359.1 amino acid ABC transporter permease [Neobacillus thermocopriae]
MNWFNKLIDTYPVFLKGMLLTFELTVVAIMIGIVIGLFFAFLKISKINILVWLSDAYIFLVRGTPLIVQIFVFYYGLTSLNMSQFMAVVLGLAFHNGAYIAEIFRGSIQSIDHGQMEAGRSLGMSVSLTYRRIILPQALRRAMPPLGNQFIIALKDSSLAAFIGMYELFNVATTFGSNTFDYLTYLLIVAVYYLVLVFLISLLARYVENRLAISD